MVALPARRCAPSLPPAVQAFRPSSPRSPLPSACAAFVRVPFARLQESGQGEHGEDRNRERAVPAVAPADRVREGPRLQAAGRAAHPVAHPVERRDARVVTRTGDGERRPAEGGGADVAGTVGGVSPTAVRVLGPDQPGDPPADGRAVRGWRAMTVDQRERDRPRRPWTAPTTTAAVPVAVRQCATTSRLSVSRSSVARHSARPVRRRRCRRLGSGSPLDSCEPVM